MYAIAREHYGLELKPGPWGINSRPALVGAKFAEVEGASDAYHQAIFEAYWLHERSIEERDTLRDVAESVGLDGDEFLTALDSPELDIAVTADVTRAQMVGITGVPALVFEQKYLVSGAQPYEVLVEVVDEITAKSNV